MPVVHGSAGHLLAGSKCNERGGQPAPSHSALAWPAPLGVCALSNPIPTPLGCAPPHVLVLLLYPLPAGFEDDLRLERQPLLAGGQRAQPRRRRVPRCLGLSCSRHCLLRRGRCLQGQECKCKQSNEEHCGPRLVAARQAPASASRQRWPQCPLAAKHCQRPSPVPSACPAIGIAAAARGWAGTVPASLPCQRAQAARWSGGGLASPLRCCRTQQRYWTQPAA